MITMVTLPLIIMIISGLGGYLGGSLIRRKTSSSPTAPLAPLLLTEQPCKNVTSSIYRNSARTDDHDDHPDLSSFQERQLIRTTEELNQARQKINSLENDLNSMISLLKPQIAKTYLPVNNIITIPVVKAISPESSRLLPKLPHWATPPTKISE